MKNDKSRSEKFVSNTLIPGHTIHKRKRSECLTENSIFIAKKAKLVLSSCFRMSGSQLKTLNKGRQESQEGEGEGSGQWDT